MHGGRIVFTHQPLWPTFIAVFEFLHLPFAVTVAVQAALCAVAAWPSWSDRRDLRGPAVVTVATGMVVLSPMVMVQSGTLLGYLPTLTLGLATTALALRAVRLPEHVARAGAGVAGGLLVVNRPVRRRAAQARAPSPGHLGNSEENRGSQPGDQLPRPRHLATSSTSRATGTTAHLCRSDRRPPQQMSRCSWPEEHSRASHGGEFGDSQWEP